MATTSAKEWEDARRQFAQRTEETKSAKEVIEILKEFKESYSNFLDGMDNQELLRFVKDIEENPGTIGIRREAQRVIQRILYGIVNPFT